MFSERDLLHRLTREPIRLPPLTFTLSETENGRDRRVDAIYDVGWNGRSYRFVAEVKARGTPQAILTAAHQAKSLAYDQPGTLPLVIVPYLSPAQLDQVESLDRVSAVDLCGNGLVRGANEFFVLRSGSPNLFREVRSLNAAYRGTSALVARALVLRGRFARVSEIREFIKSHEGRITLGTVSKALARLGEDLIVGRDDAGIQVLQLDKLLDELRQHYRPPRVRSKWTGKLHLPPRSFSFHLAEAARSAGARLAPTGVSSASHYIPIATEPVSAFYSSHDPQMLVRATGADFVAARGFANVEILQTDEETVYFDRRWSGNQLVCSPIQAWLELATGDKRTREASDNLRIRLLRGTVEPAEAEHDG